MTLQISDGVTTVTLSGDASVIKACDYFPSTPERNGKSYNDVTETFGVIMEGAASAIIATVNAIEELLDQAVDGPKRAKTRRVIITYNVTGIAETRKCEVLEGRVLWDVDPLYRRLHDSTAAVQVTVIWRRRYYWYLPSVTLTTASITNGGGGAAGNSWTWNNIQGSLPAPVRLTLTNVSGATRQTRRFYLLNDADDVLGTDAFLTPATAAVSWGAGSDHNAPRWPLVIPTTTTAKLAGERYRLLAGFSSLPDGVYVRASVYAYVSGVYLLLQRGDDVLTTGKKLLDLGSLDLSPAGAIGASSSLAIVLTVYAPLAGSATLAFVQLSPAEPALTIYQNGFGLPNASSIVTDDIDNYDYMLTARHSIIETSGEMLLYPGQANRLRLLFDEDGLFEPSRQWQVAGTYQPRKLTV